MTRDEAGGQVADHRDTSPAHSVYGVEATERTGYFPISPLIKKEAQLDMERIETLERASRATTQEWLSRQVHLINYLACPRKFYYQNILKLREEEEVSEILEKNDMGASSTRRWSYSIRISKGSY